MHKVYEGIPILQNTLKAKMMALHQSFKLLTTTY